MKRHLYYGEYTLQHWIEMMLRKNIELPKYQRHFVWSKKKVIGLVEALKNDQFVPPVTIGVFMVDGKMVNYILDGQQRLTSILLAYLKLFPRKVQEVKAELAFLANENDDLNEDDLILEDIIDWTFEKLTAIGKNREEILNQYTKEYYDVVEYVNSKDFFSNKFLGFSYIVPDTKDEKTQQKYYSSVFRSINLQGVNLLATESRKSLYFLDKGLENFFEPQIDNVKVVTTSGTTKMDFVRYLSLLSQYHKDNKVDKVSKGFSNKKSEEYYEEYIYSIVGEKISGMFAPFESVFPNKEFQNEFVEMKTTIRTIVPTEGFSSIIDMDIFMFGLIYQTVFKKNKIDMTKVNEIKIELKDAISSYKGDDVHKKSPSLLKFLRARLSKSLEIYAHYVVSSL